MNRKAISGLLHQDALAGSIIKMIESGATKEAICLHIESSLKKNIVQDLIDRGLKPGEAIDLYASIESEVKFLIAKDVTNALLDDSIPEGSVLN